MKTERLQKILARAGYGSRRTCEDMIAAGRVAVDGNRAQLGDKADPETQRITLDGNPIRTPRDYVYIKLHKPRGVISTADDPHGRKTVVDFVDLPHRLYPVGRLDAASEGLILLTNDGGLTHRLTHPRYEHPRVYRVLVSGEPTPETLTRWRRGIALDGQRTRLDDVVVKRRLGERTWLRLTVHEGRKHLVRRMVAASGHPVQRLMRIQMGPIRLGDLKPKEWRHLTEEEMRRLHRELDLAGGK